MKVQTLAEANCVVNRVIEHLKSLHWRTFVPESETDTQKLFLCDKSFESLYGGAAGGGKSSALLMIGVREAALGGDALILRRTYTDLALPGAIMDRSHDWLRGTKAKWHAQDKKWVFPSTGTLTFGYMETEVDKYRYQGAEFSCVLWDELTQFSESQYLYMRSRVRTKTHAKRKGIIRSASNPGGTGHAWVYARFVDADRAGELKKCLYWPANVRDNPHIDQDAYIHALEGLDSTTRAQLLDGQWIADGLGLVYKYSSTRNLIRALPSDINHETWVKVIGLDLGASLTHETTAFSVVAYSTIVPNLVIVLETTSHAGMIPHDIAQSLMKLGEKWKPTRIVADAGALGKGYVEEFRRRYAIPVQPATKTDKYAYISLMNGDLERGSVKIYEDGCPKLLAEVQALMWDKDSKINKATPDHCCDATLYAWREARHWQARELDKKPLDDAGAAQWEEKRMRDKIMADSKRMLSRKGYNHGF